MTCGTHLLIVDAKDAVVVRRAVQKFVFHLSGKLIPISAAGVARHAQAAKWIHASFKWTIRLEADNQFIFTVEITGLVV